MRLGACFHYWQLSLGEALSVPPPQPVVFFHAIMLSLARYKKEFSLQSSTCSMLAYDRCEVFGSDQLAFAVS
jgi:hypothetical protein